MAFSMPFSTKILPAIPILSSTSPFFAQQHHFSCHLPYTAVCCCPNWFLSMKEWWIQGRPCSVSTPLPVTHHGWREDLCMLPVLLMGRT